jgi:dihydrofolate reductase
MKERLRHGIRALPQAGGFPTVASVTQDGLAEAAMPVTAFADSLDGYSAGPSQSLENPLGVGGPGLMEWFFPTRMFQSMHNPEFANTPDQKSGKDGGETDIDEDFAVRSFVNIGAWIMGRNMFGPVRGPWPNDDWKGWWGDNPVYHCDVFVLTHHARAPLVMEGGTTFHFVTEGSQSALQRARAAAGDKDVRIAGGAATVRAYLQAGLVDAAPGTVAGGARLRRIVVPGTRSALAGLSLYQERSFSEDHSLVVGPNLVSQFSEQPRQRKTHGQRHHCQPPTAPGNRDQGILTASERGRSKMQHDRPDFRTMEQVEKANHQQLARWYRFLAFRRYQGTAEDHGQDCGAIQKVRRHGSGPGVKDRFLSLIFATRLATTFVYFLDRGCSKRFVMRA